jgi:hypothetical protein
MKKLYIALCLVTASLSTSVFADSSIGSDNGDWQDCGPVKVEAIRVEHGAIFAFLNNSSKHWKAWKRIALNKANDDYMAKPMQLFSHSNLSTVQQLQLQLQQQQEQHNLRFKTEMESSQFQSLLENALLHNKKIIVRFPGNETCSADNWASNAVMVQLNK